MYTPEYIYIYIYISATVPLARGACGFSMVQVFLLHPLPEYQSGMSPIIRQGT